ncbi:outer membrane beta-barrel family protein [Pedobacter sp. SYP-B3415]|uniref:outer membrane beta-barrel family protein n=1 Tax=Pedobacter sp. SYP-B3415 TaxID=2496641 RepID=UPI00101B8E7E|nr:outer membrane beta-barrel family protein [Pedobacter sp. SYP-B3415]
MKLFTCIILIFISAFSAMAQRFVRGKVKDEKSAGVPFSTVLLIPEGQTSPVAQKIADSAGNYELQAKTSGKYRLKASAVGYTEKSMDVIVGQSDLKEDITLKSTGQQLSDVVVAGRKPLITRKADRIVMNIENNALASGKSSLEAMSLAPGVFVRDGKISINGNSGTRVMVNGKLLQLSGDDLTNYLNSLRSDEIESMEIIAHPPAEYDAQGTGGMINIVLKKQGKAGLNGSVYSNYRQGRYGGFDNGVQANFKKGKLGVFANYSYSNMKRFNDIDQSRNFPQNGLYSAINNGISRNTGQRIRVGGTFDINDKQYVAVDYTGSLGTYNDDFSARTQIIYPNVAGNSVSRGVFPARYASDYHSVGLNYHLKTDTVGSELVILSDFSTNNARNRSEGRTSFFNGSEQFLRDTAFRNSTPSEAKIFTADAKYIQSFGKLGKLTGGGKISITDIDNRAAFEAFSRGSWLQNTAQDFTYLYKENILAAYLKFDATLAGTDIQLGLRGENTDLTGTLFNNNQVTPNKRDYFNLFPSVYLKRNLNEKGSYSLSASYNRRFNRPSFFDLNPYVGYIDNYSSSMGNPYLTPEFNNAYELNFTMASKYVFTASYTRNRDAINNIIKTADNNPEMMIQQPNNIGSTENYLIGIFAPVKAAKWWEMQYTAQFSNQRVDAPQYSISKNILTLQTNQSFTLPNQWSVNLNAFYLSNIIFANAVIDPLYAVNVGVQKKLFKNKLVLKANVDDVFFTNKVSGAFFFNDLTMNFSQVQQDRRFTLGLTWNFDLGKAFKMKNVESSSDDVKSRLK